MKLILTLILSISAYGQATINAPAVSVDSASASAILSWMAGQAASKPRKLMEAITAGSTQITVDDGAGIGNAAVIAIDGEHMAVANRSGNKITVQRGSNGTTAAAHGAGVEVIEMKYKTLRDLAKSLIVDALRSIVEKSAVDSGTITVRSNARGQAAAGVQ